MSICELGQLWVQPKGYGSWNVLSELTINGLKNLAQTSHPSYTFSVNEKIRFLLLNNDYSSFNWVLLDHFLNIIVEKLEIAKKTG